MNVEFLEPAARELYEAVVFYNIQRQGLGQEFAKKVEDTIERIKQKPGPPSLHLNGHAGA